jgi:hypothetical protein
VYEAVHRRLFDHRVYLHNIPTLLGASIIAPAGLKP